MGKPKDPPPADPEPTLTRLPIRSIDPSPAQAVRHRLDGDAVERYAEAADVLPPVHVHGCATEPAWYGLSDGGHRLAAWESVGRSDVPCLLWLYPTREDAERAAWVAAWRANDGDRPLPRSNLDKRACVRSCLLLPWTADLTDRQIAEMCGVTHPLIRPVREELSHNGLIPADSPAHASTRNYKSGSGPRPGFAYDGRGGVVRTCPRRDGRPDECVGVDPPEAGCGNVNECEYLPPARPEVVTPEPGEVVNRLHSPEQSDNRYGRPGPASDDAPGPSPPPPPPAARPDRPRPDRYREPPPPPPENERLAERVASALQSLKAVLGVINEVIDSPFAALVADAAGRTGTKLEAAGSRLDARLGPVEIRTRLMTTPEIVTLADLLCDVKAGLLRDSPREVRAPWERSPTPDAEPDADPIPAADPGPLTAASPVVNLDLPPDTMREVLKAGIATVGELAATVGTERRFGLDDDELERLCIVLEPFMPPDADEADREAA